MIGLVHATENGRRRAEHLAAVERAQADGVLDPTPAARDVYSLVLALSMAWSPASVTTAASIGDAESAHVARRAALAAAVRGAFAPPGSESAPAP